MSRSLRVLLSPPALLTAALTGPAAAAGPPREAVPTLEQCDARVRRAPNDRESYRCYVTAARGRGIHAEAARRLDALVRRAPSPGALLSLATLEQDRGRARAEALYRSSIERASQAGDARGETLARAELGSLLCDRGREDEAKAELERALALAEAKGDAVLQARVWVSAAKQANQRNEHGKARELLARAETVAFPDGPPELKSQVLSQLGYLNWAQGDFLEALKFYRRELEVLQQSGDVFHEAGVRYDIALMYATGRLAGKEEIRSLEREALVAAVRGNNRGAAADVHLNIGQGLDGREAIAHYRQGLELATRSNTRLFAMRCLGKATFQLGPKHRAEGVRWIERALEEARSQGNRFAFARTQVIRAWLAVEQRAPREEIVRRYLQTFDAVEAIRDLQPEGLLRSRVFGQWAFVYYRFAGRLLGTLEQSAEPERDVERAFLASERLRARSLLDRFDAAGVSQSSGQAASLHEERRQVLERIVRLQRELMSLDLARERRQQALSELDRLEREEGALRDRIARVDARFAALRAPAIPTPKEVQQALRHDEAFLGYQVWYDFRRKDRWEPGGSWLYAITRSAVRVFQVPTRDVLDEKVAVFNGLFESRDSSEARPAAVLYQDLLGAALRELPASITRLVIVPDGALYQLPFAALRASPSEPPLTTRYDLSYAPSATLWMRWRANVGAVPTPRALALADPALQGTAETALQRAADPWREGLRSGRLPFARLEARALVRGLGGGLVRSGPEASEGGLKRTDLRSFGSLVFATHAVVDDEKPERSAVLLAPGGPHEDGLLQFREIAELDLKDRVVILSACRSAVGADLVGEGVMGLAHAFFQAGARAVVASLWMLRDDEQSELARRLADELASGRSLGTALAAAQRSLVRDGTPAASWAGLVVLGDGERVLRPAGRVASGRAAWWVGGGLAGVAALLLPVLVRRHRRLRARR